MARLARWIERLAIPRHFFANRAANAWIRDEIAGAFERAGLAVRIEGRFGNVIALPPSVRGEAIPFVGAHFDAVPDCPGADDNASGVAVMLECAREMARRGARVGFVAFNAEEDGLLGSRDFVDHALGRLPVRIREAHVLEMVGFRTGARQTFPVPWVPRRFGVADFIGLIGKGRANRALDVARRSVAAPGLRVVAAKTWGPLHWLLPDLTRSDHFPLWGKGVPAILWTDTASFRNPHYHQPSDRPETLDYDFMAEVSELLVALVDQGESGRPKTALAPPRASNGRRPGNAGSS